MRLFTALFLVLGLLAVAPAGEPPAPPKDKKEETKSKTNGKGHFTFGKETTYVTRPLTKDGYPDYVAALNERLRQGATPENNAVVLLWQALGPKPEGAPMPAEFYELLGMKEPPKDGTYLVSLGRYAQDKLKIAPGKDMDEILDQQGRATQRPWTAKDYPNVASWLEANDKPLALVIEATGRSHYFSPLVPPKTGKASGSLIGVLLPAVQKCREAATLLSARAMLRVAEGDQEGAWKDLLACHRLGRLVGSGATLIEGLVGIAIDAIACRADLAFLDRARPDVKRLASCQADLQKLPPVPDIAGKVDLAERFMFLDSVMLLDRHGIKYLETVAGSGEGNKIAGYVGDWLIYGIDWDPALRTGNQWYDRLADALRDKDRPDREDKLKDFQTELKETRAAIFNEGKLRQLVLGSSKDKGKLVGDILVTLLMPAVVKVQSAADRCRQVQDNTIIAFALARYERDHGHYPKELDALAPKYLAEVPKDIFSGGALIYRPNEKGYLLYSIGANGIDEGGRWYDDEPPGDDPSVRMPLPELRRK
jgi:hypothetical protein